MINFDQLFKWIVVVIFVIFLWGFFICFNGCNYEPKDQLAVQNGEKDFCSLNYAIKYYITKENCCSKRMLCGNDAIATWNSYKQKCSCSAW
jgi:hypothetical protein